MCDHHRQINHRTNEYVVGKKCPKTSANEGVISKKDNTARLLCHHHSTDRLKDINNLQPIAVRKTKTETLIGERVRSQCTMEHIHNQFGKQNEKRHENVYKKRKASSQRQHQ